MAPVRRYLRITQRWVIEVRIYSEPPSIADSWLLKRADPALPRIMAAVKPHVMPKLREERERAGKKGKAGKKAVKDTVAGGTFCRFDACGCRGVWEGKSSVVDGAAAVGTGSVGCVGNAMLTAALLHR